MINCKKVSFTILVQQNYESNYHFTFLLSEKGLCLSVCDNGTNNAFYLSAHDFQRYNIG